MPFLVIHHPSIWSKTGLSSQPAKGCQGYTLRRRIQVEETTKERGKAIAGASPTQSKRRGLFGVNKEVLKMAEGDTHRFVFVLGLSNLLVLYD